MDATAPLRNNPVDTAPLSDWFAIHGPSASADNSGTIIQDPYGIAALLDPMSRGLGDAGGRMARWSQVQGGYLIWPCLTTAGATLQLQLWDFSLAPAGPVSIGPAGRADFPGIAVNRSYDIPGSAGPYVECTVVSSARESFKLSFLDERFPHVDLTGGTQFYPTERPLEIPFRGGPLSLVTIKSLTGTALVLSKPY